MDNTTLLIIVLVVLVLSVVAGTAGDTGIRPTFGVVGDVLLL